MRYRHRTLQKPPSLQRGWTMMELVVGLGLTTLTALAISQAVTLISQSLGRVAGASSAHVAQLKAATMLRSALSDADRTRINLGPFITSQESISQQPHPLSSLTGTSAPRADSHILSIVELSPLHRGVVTSTTFQAGTVAIAACGFSAVPDSADFRSFVAVSPSGAVTLVGEVQKTSATCGVFSGKAHQSLISRTQIVAQGFIALWPVRREYSLFVDRSGQFRLASHIGDKLLENQPIARGFRSLMITRRVSIPQVEYFDVTVRASGIPPLRIIVPRLFRTRELWHELGVR